MPPRLLTPRERLEARLVTGPLGHLYAGVADVVTLLAHLGRARMRARRS